MWQRCRSAAGECYACGRFAGELLNRKIGNKRVPCRPTGATTYNRIVAVCEAGGKDLGLEILRAGMALANRHYLKGVPGKLKLYLAAEKSARQNRRGLWAGEFVMTERWRLECADTMV